MPFPTVLDTPRLRLRKPVMSDAAPIFSKYAQDSEVTRFLSWQPHRTIQETEAFLRQCMAHWDEESSFGYVMVRKSDGGVLGTIGLKLQDHAASAGYVLAKRYWGRGYTTEALIALRDLALAQAHIYRFWAVCDVDNTASARVMEKAGLSREGVLRRFLILPNLGTEPRDCYCYATVK